MLAARGCRESDGSDVLMRTCDVQGCPDPHLALGLCNAHWKRRKRHGDATAPHLALPFTPREDAALLGLATYPRSGWVKRGQLEELSIVFGRSVGCLKQRRRYLLGRVKPHPGPQARRSAAKAAQADPSR